MSGSVKSAKNTVSEGTPVVVRKVKIDLSDDTDTADSPSPTVVLGELKFWRGGKHFGAQRKWGYVKDDAGGKDVLVYASHLEAGTEVPQNGKNGGVPVRLDISGVKYLPNGTRIASSAKLAAAAPTRRDYVCRECGVRGHYRRHCPLARSRQSSQRATQHSDVDTTTESTLNMKIKVKASSSTTGAKRIVVVHDNDEEGGGNTNGGGDGGVDNDHDDHDNHDGSLDTKSTSLSSSTDKKRVVRVGAMPNETVMRRLCAVVMPRHGTTFGKVTRVRFSRSQQVSCARCWVRAPHRG